ncbi:MAG TPA: hypothetical protein VGQ26_29715 [Streptosporangiaceae bacterium]|nr:hypothetical protein [Streptosporangiaceae bacterium]
MGSTCPFAAGGGAPQRAIADMAVTIGLLRPAGTGPATSVGELRRESPP